MNQILRQQVNETKIKEVRARFKNVKIDQADSRFIFITKICFMSYDLLLMKQLHLNVIGFFEKNGLVEAHIKL